MQLHRTVGDHPQGPDRSRPPGLSSSPVKLYAVRAGQVNCRGPRPDPTLDEHRPVAAGRYALQPPSELMYF
jgi:hypothetical protein